MSWVTVIWSMTAAICLTLAGIHLMLWLRTRSLWTSLLFASSALAVAAIALLELTMMRAQTTAHYGNLISNR